MIFDPLATSKSTFSLQTCRKNQGFRGCKQTLIFQRFCIDLSSILNILFYVFLEYLAQLIRDRFSHRYLISFFMALAPKHRQNGSQNWFQIRKGSQKWLRCGIVGLARDPQRHQKNILFSKRSFDRPPGLICTSFWLHYAHPGLHVGFIFTFFLTRGWGWGGEDAYFSTQPNFYIKTLPASQPMAGTVRHCFATWIQIRQAFGLWAC